MAAKVRRGNATGGKRDISRPIRFETSPRPVTVPVATYETPSPFPDRRPARCVHVGRRQCRARLQILLAAEAAAGDLAASPAAAGPEHATPGGFPLDSTISQFQPAPASAMLATPPPTGSIVTSAADLRTTTVVPPRQNLLRAGHRAIGRCPDPRFRALRRCRTAGPCDRGRRLLLAHPPENRPRPLSLFRRRPAAPVAPSDDLNVAGESAPFSLAVLNPGGRDPEQHFPAGAGQPERPAARIRRSITTPTRRARRLVPRPTRQDARHGPSRAAAPAPGPRPGLALPAPAEKSRAHGGRQLSRKRVPRRSPTALLHGRTFDGSRRLLDLADGCLAPTPWLMDFFDSCARSRPPRH